MDAPIRVEEHDFNISAPHMHVSRTGQHCTAQRMWLSMFDTLQYTALQFMAAARAGKPALPGQPTSPAPPTATPAPGCMLARLQATCLEALQLQPGHRFLDVGSGCGVLTACGAFLVGRQGSAVGFEVRRECIQMGRDALRRLTATNPE